MRFLFRGDNKIRTGARGVADLCLTTWLCRRTKQIINDRKTSVKQSLNNLTDICRDLLKS